MKQTEPRDNRSSRLDGLRWVILKRVCPKVNRIELLGYTASLAGYSDYPTLNDERFEVFAPGATPGPDTP